MPSKRRNPQPIPQEGRPQLPPLGILIADDDGERLQCHVCGAFWRGLVYHVRQSHYLDAATYRETYGLNRTAVLVSPALQASLRIIHAARLDAIRPDGRIMDYITIEDVRAISGQPRRLQMRLKRSADAQAQPRRPKRPRPAPMPVAERVKLATAAKAELLKDPTWHAEWQARIREGKRLRAGLTLAQEQEIRTLKGAVSKAEIKRRFHIGLRTIRRLWGA